MTPSPNATTDQNHTTRSLTTTTHTNDDHQAPEDQPTDKDQDPKFQHTQASGSPGTRREPWRAAAKINCKGRRDASRSTTDGQRIGRVPSC